jgi:hypothetical protein
MIGVDGAASRSTLTNTTPKGARSASARADRKRANARARTQAREAIRIPRYASSCLSLILLLAERPTLPTLFVLCTCTTTTPPPTHPSPHCTSVVLLWFFLLGVVSFFIFISCMCTISHLISPILILISCTIRRASPPSPFPTHWPSIFIFVIHSSRYTDTQIHGEADIPACPTTAAVDIYTTIRYDTGFRDSLKTYLFRSGLL